MSSLIQRFARAVVWARWLIVVGWIGTAVVLAFELPTLEEAPTGALGQIVPAGSDVLRPKSLPSSSSPSRSPAGR